MLGLEVRCCLQCCEDGRRSDCEQESVVQRRRSQGARLIWFRATKLCHPPPVKHRRTLAAGRGMVSWSSRAQQSKAARATRTALLYAAKR